MHWYTGSDLDEEHEKSKVGNYPSPILLNPNDWTGRHQSGLNQFQRDSDLRRVKGYLFKGLITD